MASAAMRVSAKREGSEDAHMTTPVDQASAPERSPQPHGASLAFAFATGTAPLQRSPSGSAPGEAPPIVHEVLRAPGAPLDRETRNLMEGSLGSDLSRVRVHTDERAAASARAVNALAYTVGNSIVFDCGRYAPHQAEGRGLLAHELVHTIQQGGVGPPSSGQRLRIDSPDSTAEGEARRNAAASRLFIQRCGDTKHSCPSEQQSALRSVQALSRAIADGDEEAMMIEASYSNVLDAETLVATLAPFCPDLQLDSGEQAVAQAAVQRHTKDECDEQYEECGDTCRSLPAKNKKKRALCWAACMAAYAACLSTADETLTAAAIVAAIVLAASDGPLPIGDAAAAVLLFAVRARI